MELSSNKKIWNYYQTSAREKFLQAHKRFDYLVRIILKLKKGGKCLDIGLGDGYFLEKMIKNGFESTGIDIAEESIQINKDKFNKLGLRAEIKEGNINNIPFEENTFDIVMASEVLEHLSDDDLQNGIKEVTRVLKTGGSFIGTVPADENLSDNLCFCPVCENIFHKWGHKRSFDYMALKYLLEPKFKNVKILKIPSIPHKTTLFTSIKFYVKLAICNLKVKNYYIGNYVIIAQK